MMSGMRNFIDCSIECVLVCFRRFGEPAQLSNELHRRRVNFVLARRRTEVMKCFDGSAHGESLTADYADENGFCWLIAGKLMSAASPFFRVIVARALFRSRCHFLKLFISTVLETKIGYDKFSGLINGC